MTRGIADEVEQLRRPGPSPRPSTARGGPSITSTSWSRDPEHRVEGVHGALEDDGDLPPAQAPELLAGSARGPRPARGKRRPR